MRVCKFQIRHQQIISRFHTLKTKLELFFSFQGKRFQEFRSQARFRSQLTSAILFLVHFQMTLKISSAFDVTEILILQSTQELSERPVNNFGISAQLPPKFSSPRSPRTNEPSPLTIDRPTKQRRRRRDRRSDSPITSFLKGHVWLPSERPRGQPNVRTGRLVTH